MDWLKDLLKKAGFDESKIDALIGDVNKELPKHFVPKQQYNDAAEAKKQAEKDRDAVNSQLDELKKSAGDNQTLKDQIEKLQADNKAAKDKYEADTKALQLATAVKLALAGEAHDPDIVAGLLDKAKIELNENGGIKAGLDDQVKALRESKGFLFAEKGDDKPKFKGAKPPEGSDKGKGEADEAVAFAKSLAALSKPNEAMAKAQKSYFE